MTTISKSAFAASVGAAITGATPLLMSVFDQSASALLPTWASNSLLALALGLAVLAWRTRGI